MFSSNVFSYVNVLNKAADASWLREETIANNLANVNTPVYVDSANYSYRIDKNNVDVDVENVELASEKLRYDALTDSMTQEFARLKSVMQ